MSKIAVCITTHNRYDVFKETYENVKSNLPKDSKLIVVDDCSYIPVPEATFRFDTNVGVATAKNKCLEFAEGADFIFLLDDDVRILDSSVWQQYIDSGENCLMYQFKLPNKPPTDMRVLYRDDKLISYSHTRGCFIFITKKVLEVVGGMDTRYTNSFEHPSWIDRIYNSGLTKYRAADLVDSEKLLVSLDQDNKIESSIKKDPVQNMKNYRLYKENRQSKAFMEYK